MKVFVIGATGVLGRHVLPRLLERGHQVRAVVRQANQAKALRRLGIEGFAGDILDAPSLFAPMDGCDAVLHLATAVPRPGQPRDMGRNDLIRAAGTRNLLDAAERLRVRRYVQQSITFLYGDRGLEIADESTPIRPTPFEATIGMENSVRASDLDWCILRGGAFYGPHTGQEQSWRERLRDGSLRLPGDGTGLVSLIHEMDMAQAIVLAMEHAPAHSLYNVVDDQPVTYETLFGHLAAQSGAPAPSPGGPKTLPFFGCRNDRLKDDLGWSPAYPTYRSGLAE